MNMRDSMIFYRSFYDAIKELPKETQGEIYDAIFSYGLDFTEKELSGIAKTIRTLIKPQIEANIKRYEVGSKQGKHGKKGGRPQKPQNNPIGVIDKNPSGVKKENPNLTPNVNDNVNVYNNITNTQEGKQKIRELVPEILQTKENQLKCLWEMIQLGWGVEETKDAIMENIKWIEESVEKYGHSVGGIIDWQEVLKRYFAWRTWYDGKGEKPKNYRSSLNTFLDKSRGIQKK